MKIGVIGHNYTHGADFVMNYPKGPGCYLFLLVKSPARFLLNGKKLRLEKNTILFFTPHTACRYAAENGTYTDDWFLLQHDTGGGTRPAKRGYAL